MPPCPHLPLDTGRNEEFHLLARPASLHQLLPTHKLVAQLHGTEAKPPKLKTVRAAAAPMGSSSSGRQSWVECPSLCGAMPRGAMPQMLSWDAGLSRPSLAVPRHKMNVHSGGGWGAMPYGAMN